MTAVLARFALAGLLVAMVLIFGRPLSIKPASAQPQCNDRAAVLEYLSRKYKEAPIAVGVTNTGGLVEVLSDGRGGSWTIIVTTPRGMSCLVAAGEGWRRLDAPPAGPRT